jgi:molybdate transport system regulatory protein
MRLSIRIELAGGGRLGPGKCALLKAIEADGSISGAARSLGMSYRRAWVLINELNHLFAWPLVETATGGDRGGGAKLTEAGRDVLARYEAVQRLAEAAAAGEIAALDDLTIQPG